MSPNGQHVSMMESSGIEDLQCVLSHRVSRRIRREYLELTNIVRFGPSPMFDDRRLQSSLESKR